MSETLDFLIPGFEQLSPAVVNAALSDVSDPKLRKAMLADPGLKAGLVSVVLNRQGLSVGLPAPSGQTLSYLERIAGMKIQDLTLRLGAAAWSESLARAVLTGLKDTDLPRDVVKASLLYRQLALWPVQRPVPDCEALFADGHQTLNCWLDTLPPDAAQLIRLRLEPVTDRGKRAEREKRQLLCETVLSDLIKAEVAQ